MKRQMFGVVMISPLQALANPEDVIARKEATDVAIFESPASAFQYIIEQGEMNGVPGHITPIGHALNRYFEVPSVGIMYRLVDPADMVIQPQEVTHPSDVLRGMQYHGPITPFDVVEQKAILVSDEFHTQQVEPIEMSELRETLSKRLKCFDKLEEVLENTPAYIRKNFSPENIPVDAIKKSLGPDAPVHHDFVAPQPQDQKFWDVQKTLWDNKAGFPYVVDMVPFTYNRYRDVYARNIVGGDSMEVASSKAAAVVVDRMMKKAVELKDGRMEGVLQDIGEAVALDALRRDTDEPMV